jgi:hypothetical protein
MKEMHGAFPLTHREKNKPSTRFFIRGEEGGGCRLDSHFKTRQVHSILHLTLKAVIPLVTKKRD